MGLFGISKRNDNYQNAYTANTVSPLKARV